MVQLERKMGCLIFQVITQNEEQVTVQFQIHPHYGTQTHVHNLSSASWCHSRSLLLISGLELPSQVLPVKQNTPLDLAVAAYSDF